MRGEPRQRKKAILAGALVTPCMVMFLVTCEERAERPAAPSGVQPLGVEAHLPLGETPPRATVDVIFDRPMVRLGESAPSLETGAKLLQLEPQPAGWYSWIGTRTLCYTVPGGLPAATTFRARIPAGIAALDGSSLGSDIVWEFSTRRPELLASEPADGDSLVRPGDPFALLFNQPVEPEAVARVASCEGVESWQATRPDSALLRQLGRRFWSADLEYLVMLLPQPALSRDRDYTLTLGAELRARSGPLGPAEPIRVPFRTYPPPALVRVRAEGAGVLRLEFRTPVDADSARAFVTLEPASVLTEAWDYGRTVFLAGQFGFEKRYAVTVRAGLPDLFGQRSPEPVRLEVTTGRRSPLLQLLPDDAVLLPGTPRTAALVFASLGPVRLRAAPLGVRDQIRSQPSQVRERWSIERRFEPREAGALASETVDLRAALPASGLGAVLVEASGRPANGDPKQREWTARSWLRWSDLGVSLKTGPENGRVWTTRLATGAPRPGVALRILDDSAATLWSGRTDARGLAEIPGFRELGREPWRLRLVAASGADTALSSFQPDWRLEPWRFDIPGAYGVQPVDQGAFLYSDRDLYRPGDTIRLAGLVRRFTSGGLAPAGLDSVEIVVADPRGRGFARQRVALDRAGSLALDLPTTRAAALGRYWIEARMRPPHARSRPSEWRSIGSLGVALTAYRAPGFRTAVEPRAPRVTTGDTIAARVSGAYYFGTPLAGASYAWDAVRTRVDFAPSGFESFSFSDPGATITHGGLLASGRGTLGDSGSDALRLPLPPEIDAVTQAIHLEASVEDPSGDEVTGRATVLYHPAPVYAGVAIEPSFVHAGETCSARVVAVRADTALASPGTPLDVELVRRDWRAVRKLLVGGRVGYETTAVDSVLETRAVTAAAAPVSLGFAPGEPGSYRVRVRAHAGGTTSPAAVATFYVAGARAGAWRPQEALQIEMRTDRPTYAVGDTARILITTPVRAPQALLTIEREGVLESRLVRLDGVAEVVAIPVRPEYLPNVYVGIAAAEPALSAEEAPSLPEPARLPRYVVGYVPLRVDVERRRLAVAVHPEREEYRPGDRARIDVQVQGAEGGAAAGQVGIAVVDEAVLALLCTPVPDPFEFFYRERSLAVGNGDTRLQLSAGSRLEAARFKGETGGGGGEPLATRSLFTTTAYWNPRVETDALGRARVEFVLPDNLTRFRIIAVAVAGVDRFGSGSAGFRVAKPLTVEPALPRFALVGDTLEVAAVVTNRSAKSSIGSIRLETDLELRAPGEMRLALPAGGSRRVAFRCVASRPGEARVRFEARLGDATDAVQVPLAVDAARLEKTAATAAHTTATALESVALPAAALAGSARLEVGLAASALAGARPAYDYVIEYPYGCIEQHSSRLLVLVMARSLFAISAADSGRDAARIVSTIAEIEALASSRGRFSFWRGGREAPAWLTAYATLALGRAQRAGFQVSPELLRDASRACVEALGEERPVDTSGRRRFRTGRDPGKEQEWWRQLPIGLGMLALAESVRPGPGSVIEPADVDLLADHVDQLADDEQLFAALALRTWALRPETVDRILRRALGRAEVTADGAVVPAFEPSGRPAPFRTTARATSSTLWLAARVVPGDPLVPRLAAGLLAMRVQGHWATTQDDALALLALEAYRDNVERAAGTVDAQVRLAGAAEPLATLAAPAGAPLRVERAVALPLPGAPTSAATLEFATRGPLHYTAVLRWEEDARRQPADETGYAVVRHVDRLEGSGPIRLGDLVTVTLEIVVPRESWYLAVVDPLPAGLEIVQSNFVVESRRIGPELARSRAEHPSFPVSYVERQDRELRLFADAVAPGVYAHRYVARVRSAGGFAHLPARIEAMYAPELHGATAATRWRALGPQPEASR